MADPSERQSEYIVDPGDGLSKIAHESGLDPATIWDHPKNAELKKAREHGEILMPGDAVFLPEKKPDELPAKPKEVNHYEVETIPSKVQIQVTFCGKPYVEGKEYEIFIEGESQGTLATKAGGKVEFYVEPDVTEVTLRFKDPAFECELLVGHLDPLDEDGGVAQRLNNLGYGCPLAPPSLPEGSKAQEDAQQKHDLVLSNAIKRFQEDAGLPLSGVADEATLAKLEMWTNTAGS